MLRDAFCKELTFFLGMCYLLYLVQEGRTVCNFLRRMKEISFFKKYHFFHLKVRISLTWSLRRREKHIKFDIQISPEAVVRRCSVQKVFLETS